MRSRVPRRRGRQEAWETRRVANTFWLENQNERGHLEEWGLNRRPILRWIMKKMCWGFVN